MNTSVRMNQISVLYGNWRIPKPDCWRLIVRRLGDDSELPFLLDSDEKLELLICLMSFFLAFLGSMSKLLPWCTSGGRFLCSPSGSFFIGLVGELTWLWLSDAELVDLSTFLPPIWIWPKVSEDMSEFMSLPESFRKLTGMDPQCLKICRPIIMYMTRLTTEMPTSRMMNVNL